MYDESMALIETKGHDYMLYNKPYIIDYIRENTLPYKNQKDAKK